MKDIIIERQIFMGHGCSLVAVPHQVLTDPLNPSAELCGTASEGERSGGARGL